MSARGQELQKELREPTSCATAPSRHEGWPSCRLLEEFPGVRRDADPPTLSKAEPKPSIYTIKNMKHRKPVLGTPFTCFQRSKPKTSALISTRSPLAESGKGQACTSYLWRLLPAQTSIDGDAMRNFHYLTKPLRRPFHSKCRQEHVHSQFLE